MRIKGTLGRDLHWIRVGDVVIDARAQREFRPGYAQDIADRYNADLIGYPCVARIGAVLHACDGQHRIAATRLKYGDDARLQCEVFSAVSIEDAAQIFLGRNKVKHVSNLDAFHVGVTAGDPECLAITAILSEFGLRVGKKGAGGVDAVASLRAIYRAGTGGGENLRRTIAVCVSAWGADSHALSGDILRGVDLFLSRYAGQVDLRDLTARLAAMRNGANGILGRGRTMADTFRVNVATGVGIAILQEYNTRRRAGKLAEWKDAA